MPMRGQNPSITIEVIQANPDKPWDWHWLTHNKPLRPMLPTFDFVVALMDLPWDWCRFSMNPRMLITTAEEAHPCVTFRHRVQTFLPSLHRVLKTS